MKYNYIFFYILLLLSCTNSNELKNNEKKSYLREFNIYSDTVRYEYIYLNDELIDSLKVYYNNKLIKYQIIKNKSADSEFKIYYLNGNIMYDGLMKDGGVCHLNEYDENGKLKNEDLYCEVFAKLDNGEVNVYFDFFDVITYTVPREFAYAFYKITDENDTINLMENKFERLDLDTALYIIPFNYEHTGKYKCDFALTSIYNYEYWLSLHSFNFWFDENGILISEDFQMPPTFMSLEYPYTLILDTLYYDNYDDLLNKENLIIENLVPKSKYNIKNRVVISD